MGIKVLDKNTAEQIAAGEVIENPASVVKELVENALDAGATRIDVEISGGGKNSIIVTDNGSGLTTAELPLAFKRFATSKLSILDDLYSLTSLGFRGEALPSIAAIARVSLTTKTDRTLSGSRISLAGGEILKQEEVGAPPGTRVEVTDLFYNTPGRLKFLRADAVESTRISTLISELSLSNSAVAFNLKSGTRMLFNSSGDGVLLHVIASLYGNNNTESMLNLNHTDNQSGCRINGFISTPHLTRSSRRWITMIVNGRLIKNPLMVNALERGYGDLLPRQRHPIAVLHLSIPPDRLDVNVHPAKQEIRFQEPETIKTLIYKSVKMTLQNKYQLPEWPQSSTAMDGHYRYRHDRPDSWKENSLFDQQIQFDPLPSDFRDICLESEEETAYGERTTTEGCRLIGQYLQSYLVVEKNDQLLLIDQHAAHERVIYNQLKNSEQTTDREHGSQLTVALIIDLPTAWRNRMARLLPQLKESGFDLEAIGEDSYAVRSVPFLLRGDVDSAQLYDLLEDLFTSNDHSKSDYREAIRKTLACHRSIKAKQPLSRVEMERLLWDWERTPEAQLCPHGRPTVISFNRSQLEKSFHRKGS